MYRQIIPHIPFCYKSVLSYLTFSLSYFFFYQSLYIYICLYVKLLHTTLTVIYSSTLLYLASNLYFYLCSF